MEKMLVATDFSAQSIVAAKYAHQWSILLEKELEVIHLDLLTPMLDSMPVSESHIQDMTQVIEQQFTKFKSQLGFEIKEPIQVLKNENLKHSFQDFFSKNSFGSESYLFVGAKNHDFLNRFFLGSFTEKVVQLSPIPIVVCKSENFQKPNDILVAVDFSSNTEKILQKSKMLAQSFKANIHLVNVINTNINQYAGLNHYFTDQSIFNLDGLITQQVEMAKKELEKIAQSMQISSFEVHCTVEKNIGAVLGDYATKNRYDLIVVAEHQRNAIDRLILGHTTVDLIRSSDKNICVIK